MYGVVEEVLEDRIVIRPDEEQKDEFVPIEVADENDKLALVKEAGIVGMGGAGFPTGVKLGINLAETEMAELDPEINPELPAGFRLEHSYILINAAECEPGLEHNIRQIEEQCDKVIRGVKYCMEITHADKAVFAIKKKNEKAVEMLRKAVADEADIRFIFCRISTRWERSVR